ncbi:hypothetical protein LJC10_00430 [Selenomonadales bacterium OttesenSCG-928-I06]|nr:hypothetical protein [Selenomonadales bacterium OttesenSCG-928-I06]
MIRFLIYALLNILWLIICYLLNPVVVLFSNNLGEYPKRLSWFVTHDNWADGDMEHNKRHPGNSWLAMYWRRVTWLYRNTGYGFRYNVLGYNLPSKINLTIKGNEKITSSSPAIEGYCFCYDKSKPLYSRGFMIYVVKTYKIPFAPRLGIRIYMGWKFMGFKEGRKMLAWHFNPFRKIG